MTLLLWRTLYIEAANNNKKLVILFIRKDKGVGGKKDLILRSRFFLRHLFFKKTRENIWDHVWKALFLQQQEIQSTGRACITKIVYIKNVYSVDRQMDLVLGCTYMCTKWVQSYTYIIKILFIRHVFCFSFRVLFHFEWLCKLHRHLDVENHHIEIFFCDGILVWLFECGFICLCVENTNIDLDSHKIIYRTAF